MDLRIIKQIRTNNFKDPALEEKFINMWKESFSSIDQPEIVYGLYYNYESNYKGDYTVGAAIKSTNDNNDTIKVPDNSKYRKFPVDKHDKDGIVHTWQKIWDLEEKHKIDRAYTYDYEKYYPNGEKEIYIAINQIN